MATYEFKVIPLFGIESDDAPALNALGKQGYRLVQIVAPLDQMSAVAYLQREQADPYQRS